VTWRLRINLSKGSLGYDQEEREFRLETHGGTADARDMRAEVHVIMLAIDTAVGMDSDSTLVRISQDSAAYP
jgi:hypothetical protein